ncbi:MAG: hypothetical protein NC332_03610 [Firmicutes bacterium]|nr:hypothetical protein [Bacillota bacterium]
MKLKCFWEHNGDDTLLYPIDYAGAYARGETLEIAVNKMYDEIKSFCAWSGQPLDGNEFTVEITEEKASDLNIRDADSDAVFNGETLPLTRDEYLRLKRIALKSAKDFLTLFNSVPNKDLSCLQQRQTFYGAIPTTANEMYQHTKNVNGYYFGEIGVDCDNDGDILSCRERGFALLEKQPNFLENKTLVGSYDELWSLKKVLRRFVWHDRIHAKAMYRMALKTFGKDSVPNVFSFTV